MKISLSWLRDYLQTAQTAQQLAETLTRSGLEVKSITTQGAAIDKVVVAQILESAQHPNADRLSVCKVDDGSGTLRQIVCGAKNYQVGDKVPLALPGAVLPGGVKIKVGKLRGVESEGMMCSSRELGLGEGADGLFILPSETAIGTELSELFPPDEILELEITPNRPDWLGIVGVAREASVFGAGEFLWKAPVLPPFKEDLCVVTIQAPEASPFYSVRRLDGLQIKPSPAWLVERLKAVGVKTISNIVDIANYVMLETGHPLHAFDAAKICGALTIRFAKQGEVLAALDGNTHHLRPSDLVIADDQGPQALAGIIGGANSGVTETTTSVLLESAVFNPSLIRASASLHGITTDAAYRFERGSHATKAMEASARATSLILELASGKPSQEPVIAGALSQPKMVTLCNNRCRALLGTNISDELIASYLQKLGLLLVDENTWEVPSWRLDLTREVDLIEEVVRLHGMESIASRSLIFPAFSSDTDRFHDVIMGLRQRLVAVGFYEARTSVLVAKEEAFSCALALANPMGEQQSVLRTGLLSGLKNVLQRNLNQGARSLRFFEIGKTFHLSEAVNNRGALKKEEDYSLALMITGSVKPIFWRSEEDRSLDVYDLKGAIDQLACEKIKYQPWKRELLPDLALMLEVCYEDMPCGYLGIMTPSAARELQPTGQVHPIIVAELSGVFFQKLMERDLWKNEKKISKFPTVTRDLALVLERSQSYESVEAALLEVQEPLLKKVFPFDVFVDPSGEKISSEKKSLALSLVFQSEERTLTAEEVQLAFDRLVARLKEVLGVEVRS
ncbi:MAG: phenylalanine--tRNA ligase subunit beta [Chthoniobacterales bacterium]|nr:phenylalanine--tRNA ligase subunit beta [Chthoniobacterales bacterium]